MQESALYVNRNVDSRGDAEREGNNSPEEAQRTREDCGGEGYKKQWQVIKQEARV
jgi:hypothetical protein